MYSMKPWNSSFLELLSSSLARLNLPSFSHFHPLDNLSPSILHLILQSALAICCTGG